MNFALGTYILTPLALALAPAPADDPSQWNRVTAADLGDAASRAQRSKGSLDLAARGDFDGDRRPDDAWLVRSGQRYGVMVKLAAAAKGKPRQYLVSTGPVADLPSRGLTTTSRAAALANLDRADRASARRAVVQSPSDTLLQVFTYESSAAVFVWNKGGFTEVAVAD